MKSQENARALAELANSLELNEADTRHQLVDPLIHDVLSWPRSRTSCEKHIRPGFADYVLTRAESAPVLIVEAKREGHYFSLPPHAALAGQASFIKIRVLLTDPDIASAIAQAREYCLSLGCEFGAITNGNQWILFPAFQPGQEWTEVRALAINGLNYFDVRFIEAQNRLSYQAIVDQGSLRRLFLDGAVANRELFYPKSRIVPYDIPVNANEYASSLRPIADRYFGVIDASNRQFMDSCYVSERGYDLAFANAKRRLEDAVTPFLKQFSVSDFRDNERGGGFGNRIAKNLTGLRPADVVVLFGGKGVGKSTFLRRLLFHSPPHVIAKNGVVIIVDLISAESTKDSLQSAIWGSLIQQLDVEKLLLGDRNQLCELFEDRFALAKNQDLFDLDQASDGYKLALNALVRQWKEDQPYVAKRLAHRIRAKHKAIIVTIDNTDHHDDQLQEFCFTVGQTIATTFPCVVVISMREERFYASSIKGVLDAYQNAGFHISSPEPKSVFLRRIEYVSRLIDEGATEELGLPPHADADVLRVFFAIMRDNFSARTSHLVEFISACTHGNIRMALELFRGFIVSGYTNVREMTNEGRWTLQIHQVIKPFMIPNRFFYSEDHSLIPNIFQIRSKLHGSHFTALRILATLIQGNDHHNPPFVPVGTLMMPFVDAYAMREDFNLNMNVLLKHSLIEANTRLEVFSDAVDSLKITTYGMFVLNALCRDFTYLELVAEDCSIADDGVSNQLAELSNDEYRCFSQHRTLDRVDVRLNRAEAFIAYLEQEEERERQLYRGPLEFFFTRSIREAFDEEREVVRLSALRNVPRKQERLLRNSD